MSFNKWNIFLMFIFHVSFRGIKKKSSMATEISQSKTICILAIVAGCFAILWPSLFYPMLKGSFAPHSNTGDY